MRTVSSYGAEIRKPNIPLRLTMKTYRQAVSYLTEIYMQVWEELREIRREQGQKPPETERENVHIPIRVKKKGDKEVSL